MSIVPDALFPSSNEYDIPDLLPSLQADYVDLPVKPWGSIARTRTHRGTYHFYVDDYRFEGLWQRPEKVWKTGCVTVIEPNFSTGPDQPRAVAIWQTYRKRWLARYWQSQRVRILVDLNVHSSVEDLNLLGVPLGWRAYATRTHEGDRESKILREAKLAEIHAESDDILFAVYGHSRWARRMCENHGWYFLNQDHWPEKAKSIAARPESYGRKVYREGFRWSSRDQAHAKTIYAPTKSEIQNAVKKIPSDYGVKVNNLYDKRVDRW